jgi:hypothetical protein
LVIARHSGKLQMLSVMYALLQEVITRIKSGDVQVLDLTKQPMPADEQSGAAVMKAPRERHSQASSPRKSWLMPHQLGDRCMGRRFAKAVNASRTPIGNFAIFDLPPKF